MNECKDCKFWNKSNQNSDIGECQMFIDSVLNLYKQHEPKSFIGIFHALALSFGTCKAFTERTVN